MINACNKIYNGYKYFYTENIMCMYIYILCKKYKIIIEITFLNVIMETLKLII